MPVKSNKYVIALAGPTAVGKTEIAIELARRYNTVVLSADSRQIYRQMSIGTAKPTQAQLAAVPHQLIDIRDITEPYSAGQWARDALTLLTDLFLEHDLVVVTGGTGLYFKALLDGFDDMPSIPESCRIKWERQYRETGLEGLQSELHRRDPDYFNQVDVRNPHRLIRALALIESTGQPFSSFRQGSQAERNFSEFRIFCNLPRPELYSRINERVDDMVAHGLIDEVSSLIEYRDLQALQTVGYSELFDYLAGKCNLETAIDKIKQHTRNYAKRQVTWFNNQGAWREFNPPDAASIITHISEVTGIS